MKNKTIATALGLVCLFVLAAVFYGRETLTAPSNKEIQTEKKLRNSEKKQGRARREDALRRENARQKLRTLFHAMSKTMAASDTQEQDEEDVASMKEKRERNQAQWKKIDRIFFSEKGAEIFDQLFDKEKKDPNWTQSIKSYAESVLASDKYRDSSVEDVDCRQTLCKVVVFHIDEQDMNKFKSEAVMEGPWQGDQYGTSVELENGVQKTIFYFSRNGPVPFKNFRNHLEKMVDENEFEEN